MASFMDTVTYGLDPAGILGLGGKGLKPQFYGGSAEALEEERKAMEAGRASGAAQVDQGIEELGVASSYAKGNAALADDVVRYGRGLGEGAITDQNRALAGLLSAATARGPSLAEAQQRAGVAALQRSMLASAAAARGGNQAAAQRNAYAAGSDMGMRLLDNQAILRAQEEDAAMQRELAARGLISNSYGARAGQGFGLIGAGMGAAGQAAGQIAGIGGDIASIGAGREGNYLGAGTNVNTAQLGADTAHATGKFAGETALQGGMLGTAGAVVGSIYGGPAGGAAGKAAGDKVSGNATGLSMPAEGGTNYDPNRLSDPYGGYNANRLSNPYPNYLAGGRY